MLRTAMLYSVPAGRAKLLVKVRSRHAVWVGLAPPLTVPRRPYSIDVRVMQEEDRIAWRQHGGHVATDRVVDDVVWGCFQDARDSRLALIVARLCCTASYELGLQVDALQYRG